MVKHFCPRVNLILWNISLEGGTYNQPVFMRSPLDLGIESAPPGLPSWREVPGPSRGRISSAPGSEIRICSPPGLPPWLRRHNKHCQQQLTCNQSSYSRDDATDRGSTKLGVPRQGLVQKKDIFLKNLFFPGDFSEIKPFSKWVHKFIIKMT